MKASIFALSLAAGAAFASPSRNIACQNDPVTPITINGLDLTRLTDALTRNLQNIGASIDPSDLRKALSATFTGSNNNLFGKRSDGNIVIDLGNADDALTQKGLDLIKTQHLTVLNEDNIYTGTLELGETGNLLFKGTMTGGDAEGLIHGPMIIGGTGSDQYNGLFQGDLTLVGEAGIVQGDAGVGGKPVMRLGLGGDRGLVIGLGEIDLVGGAANDGGDGMLTTWNQDLEEYRSSNAAAATATQNPSTPATNAAASTTTAADCSLLGLGCVVGAL